eukprot:3588589-Rhodomonas_salina.9
MHWMSSVGYEMSYSLRMLSTATSSLFGGFAGHTHSLPFSSAAMMNESFALVSPTPGSRVRQRVREAAPVWSY